MNFYKIGATIPKDDQGRPAIKIVMIANSIDDAKAVLQKDYHCPMSAIDAWIIRKVT